MLIPMESQFKLVFYSILAGMFTGILFDIYRLFRGIEKPSRIITFIEDILFWIFAGLLVFIFLLYTEYICEGIYLYLYIALGLYVYLRFISVWFLRIMYKLVKNISKFYRITKNLVIYPFKIIFYKIGNKNK